MRLRLSLTSLLGLVTLSLVLAACGVVGGGSVENPSSFSATAGVTTANLSWTPVDDATGYSLERKGSSGDYTAVAGFNTEDKSLKAFQDKGLTPNTSYTYRLKTLKDSSQSEGVTDTITTGAQGDPQAITLLEPVWTSKTPVTDFASIQGREIQTIKNAVSNVTDVGPITMNGTGAIMYYLGGSCNSFTATVAGSGTFRVAGDNQQLYSGTGSVQADLTGKQYISLSFQGSGAGTWTSPTIYCGAAPGTVNATALTGRWGEKFNWGTGQAVEGYQYGYIVPTHAANLPDGTIATWAAWKETTYGNKPGENPPFRNQTAGFLWNPSAGTAASSFTQTNNPSHDMFCAGLAVMPDGEIFSAGGGSLATTTGVDSQRRTSYFNPVSKQWAEVTNGGAPALNVEHWYGSAVALPDNRIFVVGGNNTTNTFEIRGTAKTSPWAPSTDSAIGMYASPEDMNIPNGNTKIFSGNTVSANEAEHTEVQSWYPYLNVAPDGSLFQSGPVPRLTKFSVNGTAVKAEDTVGAPAGTAQMRTWGNSIMYDVGKILVTGGSVVRGAGATNTGFTVDITGSAINAQAVPPMRFRRAHHNTVVLPTGEILAIGGNNSGKQFTDGSGFTCSKRRWANASVNDAPLTDCTETPSVVGTFSGDSNANSRWPTDIDTESVLTAELYSPASNSWRDLGEMTVPRNYHSVGILLQDGRVLAAGGGLCGDFGGVITNVPCNQPNGQIFEPPYLFDAQGNPAKRPEISSLNLGAGGVSGTFRATYNSPFNVTMAGLGDGSSITKFSMIKLSAVTHSINTDVRYLEYSVAKGNLSGSGSNYQLTLTDNKNILTPGYYFLFAINDKGVPSVAKVVQVN